MYQFRRDASTKDLARTKVKAPQPSEYETSTKSLFEMTCLSAR